MIRFSTPLSGRYVRVEIKLGPVLITVGPFEADRVPDSTQPQWQYVPTYPKR